MYRNLPSSLVNSSTEAAGRKGEWEPEFENEFCGAILSQGSLLAMEKKLAATQRRHGRKRAWSTRDIVRLRVEAIAGDPERKRTILSHQMD
jgi:hypothetical protein